MFEKDEDLIFSMIMSSIVLEYSGVIMGVDFEALEEVMEEGECAEA
jgi:hypothetical protein